MIYTDPFQCRQKKSFQLSLTFIKDWRVVLTNDISLHGGRSGFEGSKVHKSIKQDAGSLSDAAFKLIPGSLHELVTLLRRA